MKRFIFLFVIFLLFNSAKAQFSVHFGDSELKGLAGIEFKKDNVAISSGWRPLRVYEYHYNAFTMAFTLFQYPKEDSFYCSAGISTAGVVVEKEFEYLAQPSFIILMGARRYPFKNSDSKVKDRFFVESGIGLNLSPGFRLFAFEFLINFNISK